MLSRSDTLDAFIWNKGDGLLNQHIFKAIPQEEKITSYFFFWMIKEAMQNMNNDNKHGIFMQHVTLDVFNNFSVPLPPLSEQKRIATYLFQKISEADIMLDDTLSSITGYKKLKQAVITQAVTKGVRGEREMKDSKVDYIGQIPDEWVLCKLRNIGDAQNGISKASEFFGKGTPFVSYSDVYKNYALPFSVSGLVESTPEEQERYSVKEGDIFFTRTSETIEEVGFSCVCEKDIPNATFAGFLIRVRPFSDKLHTPYAKYYFRSSHLRFYLVKEMNLVTRASLGQSLLKSMPVLLPPLEEQKEIADYLDAKCAEIDRLIAKKEQLVKELESYKKSLIYEVVMALFGVYITLKRDKNEHEQEQEEKACPFFTILDDGDKRITSDDVCVWGFFSPNMESNSAFDCQYRHPKSRHAGTVRHRVPGRQPPPFPHLQYAAGH